jgi:ABC-type sugar transport system ATPase subunit
MRRLARDEMARRIAWAAEMLELDTLLDRLPKQLSGGQRQRVAMGRALVREPAVSLLDEPLSNLDAKLRVDVRAEIAALQGRTKTTMVYVTHDQIEAMTLGHRIAVLDRGRLQQVAPPQELYDQPANAFVARFIGNPPMNVFPVHHLPKGAELPAQARFAGLRPEAFALARDGDRASALEARIEHVEFLGHETLAHLQLAPDVPVVVRLDGMHQLAKDETVRLTFDPERLYLFDENERVL